MDEIRGAEKATRKAYSYMLTESQRLRNDEVRHLRKSYKRMNMLSLKSYVAKCILGGEVAYALCFVGGYLPLGRSPRAVELHHSLFETLPGFIWGAPSAILLGAFYVLAFSVIFGSYMVWMYNSSLKNMQ